MCHMCVGTKTLVVHGQNECDIPTQLPVHEDTQFEALLKVTITILYYLQYAHYLDASYRLIHSKCAMIYSDVKKIWHPMKACVFSNKVKHTKIIQTVVVIAVAYL